MKNKNVSKEYNCSKENWLTNIGWSISIHKICDILVKLLKNSIKFKKKICRKLLKK